MSIGCDDCWFTSTKESRLLSFKGGPQESIIPLGGLLEDVDEMSASLFGVVLVEVVVHHTSAEGEGHEA